MTFDILKMKRGKASTPEQYCAMVNKVVGEVIQQLREERENNKLLQAKLATCKAFFQKMEEFKSTHRLLVNNIPEFKAAKEACK